MLCKKKSKGINAKTAVARARKAAMEAERERMQAWEQAEAAWIASCPPSLKPSKAARRKADTLARRSEALAKKAEVKRFATEEQERLEMLHHKGHKQRKRALHSSKPAINVSATCDRTDPSREKKPEESGFAGTQDGMLLFNRDDHLDFVKSAFAHLSLLHARRPSIPTRPHLPSRKALYQASFVCVDA